MNKTQDYGFNSDEFLGTLAHIPYAQFLNASNSTYGLAVTQPNAEASDLNIDKEYWRYHEHEFSNSEKVNTFIAIKPRVLILHRSNPFYKTVDDNIYKYNPSLKKVKEGKAFSYLVVWFLDKNNNPLSKMPFRLLCKGYSGISFIKQYDYHDNSKSFCRQLLNVYKKATGDQKQELNEIFYAHAVYEPLLERKKVTSSYVNQSSYAVVTTSFDQPTIETLPNILIKYGTNMSQRILEARLLSKNWLNIEAIDSNNIVQEPTDFVDPGNVLT